MVSQWGLSLKREDGRPIAGESILLVDDDNASLQVLVQTLEGHGYRLLVAGSGRNALQVAARVRPALVLLDIMMPEMDGYEVCRRLKADAELASIPVIFLSAVDTTGDKVKGFNLGAVDFITKPYQPDEVLARVGTQIKLYRLERELRESNRQLVAANRGVLEAMGEGLLALDGDGRVVYANPAAERLTGWQREQLVGRFIADIGLNASDGFLSRRLPEVLAGNTGHGAGECRFKHRDGTGFDVECSISPVPGSGITGGVLVFRDITARKRAEHALRQAHDDLQRSHRELGEAQGQLIRAARLETVGRMAAGVAHEVKNPLAVIQFGADYLNRVLDAGVKASGEIEEVLEEIEDAVGRADRVIKGLLDFSRAPESEIADEDLNRLFEDAMELIAHELQPNGVKLVRDLVTVALPVQIDREQILQVLINLLMNAIQAMVSAGGEATLTVRSWQAQWPPDPVSGPDQKQPPWQGAVDGFSAGDPVCCCAIDDSGPGIDSEKLAKVFEPFFTTKPAGEGTGLGLSVTANIITLHQAVIRIVNRPAGGARAELAFHCV